MEILFPEKNYETESNLRHLASLAIEGDYSNLLVQGNDPTAPPQITITTANTAVTMSITFQRPYAQVPKVFTGIINAPSINGWNMDQALNVTKTGFTLVANSYAAQTLTLNWLAVGQSGG